MINLKIQFSSDFFSGKYLVQILFLLTLSFFGKAQNLITNPSFEDINSCYGQPADIGFDVFEWAGCTGWSNPIGSSSDLWCENPIVGMISPPQVFLGYQSPRTGQNMSGIIINDGIIISYREYIQNKLVSTLESGITYKIEFYISANGYDCYSNKYGVKFYSSKYDNQSELWLTNIIPDTQNDENLFLSDTSIWQKVEMNYVANGTENYVIIGNFQDSLSLTHSLPCDTSNWGNITFGGGYFFIDDVSIEKKPSYAEVPNVFTPNNDGVNDLIIPKVYYSKDWEMIIMNRWGNKIYTLDKTNPSWDGDNCSDGVYFYCVKDKEKSIGEGFISLIRN